MFLREAKLTQVFLHGPCPAVATEAHKYSAGPFSVTPIFSICCALSFVVVRAGSLSGGAFIKPVKSSPFREKLVWFGFLSGEK